MNEPATIVVGGKKALIDVLYELQDIYNFDITLTAKSPRIYLEMRETKSKRI